MEYYEVPLCATTWVNLGIFTLCEINQTEKDKDYMSAFVWNIKNRQIHRDRSRLMLPGAGEWEEWAIYCLIVTEFFWADGKVLEIDSGIGCTGASLVAQLIKNLPAMQETPVWFLGWEVPWRRDRQPTPVFLGFPGGLDGKESTCNVGDLGLILGLGRSPGGGHGNPLQ